MFDLVIFDCDGVLIDSEIISARMLIAELASLGVRIDLDYVARNFRGRSYPTVMAQIRREFGLDLPPGFLEAIDKATRVMPRDRIQSASDWLDLIEQGQRSLDPAKAETATKPGFVASNLGYFIGAGVAVAVVAVVALWTALT